MSRGARIAGWWHGLSQRERVLISILAALGIAAALFYGAIRPLQAARATAVSEIRSYDILRGRVLAAGTLSTNRVQRRVGEISAVVRDAAMQQGLTIASETVANGTRVTVHDAAYDKLLAWLADLAASSDARVTKLSIDNLAAPGHVAAVVEFGK